MGIGTRGVAREIALPWPEELRAFGARFPFAGLVWLLQSSISHPLSAEIRGAFCALAAAENVRACVSPSRIFFGTCMMLAGDSTFAGMLPPSPRSSYSGTGRRDKSKSKIGNQRGSTLMSGERRIGLPSSSSTSTRTLVSAARRKGFAAIKKFGRAAAQAASFRIRKLVHQSPVLFDRY